ncbi:solute carrier family 25 member 38 [Dendrothele bispora CBS 962.96]|uniref:Mitochondrial glycine transporter n=1 Tax=Dendrothele bispora (strain CBS 962.96) TaxID=1314807 RepID=A0A4S8MDS8_DENBC|nr:solute carrier family 25 member 38 [Dendrothele bispora CBS 962.96]
MKNVGLQMTSGAVSGLAATLVLQPFDLVKTRIQQGGIHPTSGAFSTVPPALYTQPTVLQTARDIIYENGVKGLWRGTSASLIRNVPGMALYLTTVTQLRTFMASSPYFTKNLTENKGARKGESVLPKLTNQGNLISGAVARVSVGFVFNPLSVMKARFESNMYAYTSLRSAFLSIARGGPSELFRGFSATSMRDAPYAGMFMVFYEGLKHRASSVIPTNSHSETAILHSVCGATASGLATVATHPFDVVKTKLQVRSTDVRYRGFVSTVRAIWAERGLMGYLDGVSLRLGRKVLSAAIGWGVYECILVIVHKGQIE